MKARLYIGVFLLLAFAAVLHAITISEFYAKRDGNSVVLVWTSEEESGLKEFRIERSVDRLHWFQTGSVTATGGSSQRNTYSFKDPTLFKGTQNNIYYRLILVYDGYATTYDVIASVEGNSGIRHTWGSIKAMFR